MLLVQMYNIFRLLIGNTDYSIVVSRMEENKNMLSSGLQYSSESYGGKQKTC